LIGIGPRGAVALKVSVSLPEVPAALFVIGQRHGCRITVRVSILWDTHQFTTRPYYIDKTETLLSAVIHNIRGLHLFLLYENNTWYLSPPEDSYDLKIAAV